MAGTLTILGSTGTIGRKTVDIAERLGYKVAAITAGTSVEKTEAQLEENIPRGDWIKAHHWLIYHGRQVCSSQRPKCGTCALSGVCQYHMSAQMPTQTEKRKTE